MSLWLTLSGKTFPYQKIPLANILPANFAQANIPHTNLKKGDSQFRAGAKKLSVHTVAWSADKCFPHFFSCCTGT